MGAPLPTISPIRNATAWHKFMLLGVPSPGSIPKGGIKGFKRETGWDKQKGKGLQGARLVLTTMPPVEGTVSLQLFTDEDFADWDNFCARVLSVDPTKQKAAGLSVYHPSFSSIGFTRCVIGHYTAPEHEGKGLYHAEIQLIEWQPPPKVSIVTVPTTAPDQGSASQGVTLDPRLVEAQGEVQEALIESAAAP